MDSDLVGDNLVRFQTAQGQIDRSRTETRRSNPQKDATSGGIQTMKSPRSSRISAGFLLAVTLLFPFPVFASGDKESAAKGDDKAKVEEVKFARIKLSGAMDEGLAPTVPFGPTPRNFRGVLGLIEKAGNDPDLAGVILEVNGPAVGFAKVLELNRELRRVKKKGKKLYVHAEGLDGITLMLGSMAHRVSIPESGWVLMPGLSAETMYFRELFDILGIRFDVTHVGAFKSAYENFAKEEMSDELRTVLGSILDEYWSTMVGLIADGRGIPRSAVEKAINDGFQTARDAKRIGLVDAVEYEDEFKSWLKDQHPGKKIKVLSKYGDANEAELNLDNPFAVFTQIAQMMNSTNKKTKSKDPKIALVYAVGQIATGKSQIDPFSGQSSVMGSDTMVAALRKATDDDTVKAIVMRVDSPGGSGLASDLIWREVIRAKKKGKPVIVSMSDVAGSGGYYIAMAADTIVAEPTTLTGSIGVVSMFLDFSRVVQRLGVNIETIRRGRSAGLFSPYTRKDADVKRRFAGLMQDFYKDFVTKVADGRGRAYDEMERVARGRVWTGRQAKDIGLVDELGGLDRAMAIAREKAGLSDDVEVLELPEPRNFLEVMSEMFGGGLISLGSSPFSDSGAAVLAALPKEAHVLMATDQGREVIKTLSTMLKVASTEQDRVLLMVPFNIIVE